MSGIPYPRPGAASLPRQRSARPSPRRLLAMFPAGFEQVLPPAPAAIIEDILGYAERAIVH